MTARSESAAPLRVVVCDDHEVLREGLCLLLSELGMQVLADVGRGEEAVAAAASLQPDVVIMDLHLPTMSGIEATRSIRARCPDVAVLVLTMLDDESALLGALRAGAGGYVLKGAGRQDLERAVTGVAHGDLVISSAVSARLRGSLDRPGAPSPFPQLGDREREVLELMARGATNERIAQALVVSVKTVRNNVSSILSKLGVDHRAAAVALARDAGLGRPPGQP